MITLETSNKPVVLILTIVFVQASQKSMLSTWSKLYKVFARCSALVVTVEENICCEELCTKMVAALNKEALMVNKGNYNGCKRKSRRLMVLENLNLYLFC